MDFNPDLNGDDIRSVAEHIFLPPKLPQRAPSDEQERRTNILLCQLTIDSMESYRQRLPADQRLQWNRLSQMIKNLQQFADIPLETDELKAKLVDMRVDGILALHVREQNAAIVVRKRRKEMVFEVFEVSPPASAVMGSEGRLICSYPGPAVKIPTERANSSVFLGELASFLTQMDRDVLDASATTTKAGSTVLEERETAHPRYISQLLIGILRGAGDAAEVSRITKRIADDVVWKDAFKPWRRSPLWLIIRVAMQTSLPLADYKTFMVFLHANVLKVCLGHDFAHDFLFVMRAKTSRRLHKLPSPAPEFVLHKIKDVAEATENVLQEAWTAVQCQQAASPPWDLRSLDFSADIAQSLPHSKDYLSHALCRDAQHRTPSQSTPKHTPRVCRTDDFSTLTGNTIKTAVVADGRIALADFEQTVQNHLDDWVRRRVDTKEHSSCFTLQSCMYQYFTSADEVYDSNPEDQSIMILTIMELWVGIDELAVAGCPLLRSYSPEIPVDFLEPLLLHRSTTLERAVAIDNYVRRHKAEATIFTSIFSDKATSNSFAVRFFAMSPDLQALRTEIIGFASQQREDKIRELDMRREEYDTLRQSASGMEHTNNISGAHTKKKCEKCKTEKHADKMTIGIHEWPLPSDSFSAQMAVFELDCPPIFSTWRAVTYKIVHDVGRVESPPFSSMPETLLENYSGLKGWVRGLLTPITLGSTTKSFIQSHYKNIAVSTATASTVCVNNGLTFRMYNRAKNAWVSQSGQHVKSTVAARCRPSLSYSSPYTHVEYAVSGTGHAPNQAIAEQSHCPSELSLHEYAAFTTLRSGPRLQWLNIARELATTSLDFNHEDVHTLITYAAWQIGPVSSDGAEREWTVELSQPEFCHVLLRVLRSRLQSIGSNRLQTVTLRTIVLLTSRLLARATDTKIHTAAYALLRNARDLAFTWFCDLEQMLRDSVHDDEVSRLRMRLCEAAFLCCAAYNVDPGHISNMLCSAEDISIVIRCAISAHDNMPLFLSNSPQEFQKLTSRHTRLMHFLEPIVGASLRVDSNGLDSAIASVWNSYEPGTQGWEQIHTPESRWLVSCTAPPNMRRVQYNLLEGLLLVDGQPLGHLPQEIVSHPVYNRIFGQRVFDVVPTQMPGMEFATRTLVADHQIFFARKHAELVIRAKRDNDVWELIPHTVFKDDLPRFFADKYVHWLDLEKKEVDFRPLDRAWRKDPNNWLLRLPDTPDWRSVMIHEPSSSYLVDFYSATFAMISKRLEPLEMPQFMTVTCAAGSLSLSVSLPRFRLAFMVNSSLELEAQNFPGMIVDLNQSTGTMFGLRSQLVLKAKDPAAGKLSKSRRVLIARGDVKFTPENNHVRVHIDVGNAEQVAYHSWEVDSDLGSLAGDGSLASRLFKSYLHALTSHCLVDPLTGRTGTEEAIRELQAAGSLSFQRLEPVHSELLSGLLALSPRQSFYPKHRKSMQTMTWSSLSPLVQHPIFYAITHSILDYAKELEQLYQTPSTVEFPTSTGSNNFLIQRFASRNAVYYPADSDTRQSPEERTPVGADVAYRSRDTLDAVSTESEYAVFKTSWLTQSGLRHIQAAASSHPFVKAIRALRQVGHDQPENEFVSLSYIPAWLKLDFSRHWIDIYNACRSADIDEATKTTQLMFSLSAMVYISPDLTPFVLPVLAFATDPVFQTTHPPHWPFYPLSIGDAPAQATVREMVTSAARICGSTLSTAAMTRNQAETQKAFKKRREAVYNSEKQHQVTCLVQALMSQTLSADICLSAQDFQHWDSWFQLQPLLSNVESYFQSCYRNGQFLNHLRQIEGALRSHSGRTVVPFVGPRYMFPCGLTTGSAHGMQTVITLTELLWERTCSIPTSACTSRLRADSPMEMGPDTSTPIETSDLQALISEFTEHRTSHLFRQYGADLETSRQDLDTHSPLSPRGELPDLIVLDAHRRHCQERAEEFLAVIQRSLSPQTQEELILSLAGFWPRLTPRSIFRKLSFTDRETLPFSWHGILSAYARAFMEYQQAQRMVHFRLRGMGEDLRKEMGNALSAQTGVAHNLDWLLIQIEGDFTARPVQIEIAREMIDPSSGQNAVMQLNMGEGKSSVIVPMVVAALADGQNLARVVVIKALSNQMFQLLVARLGDLPNRRIFYLPFSRRFQAELESVRRIQSLYERCAREGGVLVAQPEHILSYKLMGIDRSLFAKSIGEKTLAKALRKSWNWLSRVSRDVLDESDEILHVRYQLIYTAGQQMPLDDHPNRWILIQDLFSSAKRIFPKICAEYPDEVEFEGDTGSRFPTMRVLGPNAAKLFASLLADDALNGSLSIAPFALLPTLVRQATRYFIIQKDVSRDITSLVETHFHGTSAWKALLLLRGLLSESHGTLVYALERRRWRVDYGLDSSRSLLAVPYRAKDMPTLRSEFSHPDLSIALTCLTYYYSGLTALQLRQCFDMLTKLDNPMVEFDRWVLLGDIPPEFRSLTGINVVDKDQFIRFLMPMFSRNKGTIDFFLSRFVFPREAKQFAYKLTATGWDIAKQRNRVTVTGFSGTN